MKTGSSAIPGRQIGQFVIVTLPFSGNRFDFFLDYHKQLGWPAALKVLQHDVARNSGLVVRPCDYVTAVAKQLRPDFVTMCEVGLTWTGQPFSATTFIESSSLEIVISEMKRTGRTVSTDHALGLGCVIAVGLCSVHKASLVRYAISQLQILFREDGTPILIGLTTPNEIISDSVQGDIMIGSFDYWAKEPAGQWVVHPDAQVIKTADGCLLGLASEAKRVIC